jgi:ribosomal-protein-alanine N-acetyltransferase
MAFLRSTSDDPTRRLDGGRVFLRFPEVRDYAEWSKLREESRGFLVPWEPTWPDDELSRTAYRYKLRRYLEDVRDGRAYAFFVFRSDDERLVGGATLSRVQRGVSMSCSLGYWMGERFAGQGYMSAAVRALVRFAFDDLALNRVEAACQPDNAPSRALLEKVGFWHEGFARRYLKINGAWRDHLLYGVCADDQIG